MKRVLISGVLLAVMMARTHAQGRGEPESVTDLISGVRLGKFTPGSLIRIVQARAMEAIPVFKLQFATNADPAMKQALASALVRLGNSEPMYWDFLAARARKAIENDAPFASMFDARGNSIPGQLSPAFLAWAKAHDQSPDKARADQFYLLPADVTLLAVTGDARGLALLRRGLLSPNYFIQAVAAKGLAYMQDQDSIPAIIEACVKAPAEARGLIAPALCFFDGPQANTAAERFIADRPYLDELRKLRKEKGPTALFF